MSQLIRATPAPPSVPAESRNYSGATSDEQLIALWVSGRSPRTVAVYEREARRFLAVVGRPLRDMTLADLQAFAANIAHLAPRTQAKILSAIKSLLSYGQKTGYLQFNVGAALRLPKIKNRLAERIVTEEAVLKLLALEEHPRNHAIIRLFYAAGLRVSEIAGLRWRDLQPNRRAGQVTVVGKGGTTRAVVLTQTTWDMLQALRGDSGDDDPVFRSQKTRSYGKDRVPALQQVQIWRIIKAAARRAGLPETFSPHWLRHAHASHALDRGAPISLVKETLGHANVATTSVYLHAKPDESSSSYLPV